MTALRYPPATWVGGATTYGPLPDHGRTMLALVLHTTETVGMPGFNHGDTAPHLVYDPRDRTWHQWAEFDRYVGTMKGHSSGHWNCKAIQVEILTYSDRNACPANGWWVGDLTDAHYQDLAQLYQWLIAQGLTGDDLHSEPEGGWLYGTSSPHRLNQQQYDLFNGLTAHGGVGGNTHWDTGVLDLKRIWQHALEGTDMTWADIVTDETWALAYDLGYITGDADVMPDYYFADGPATEAEKQNGYNVIMQNQMIKADQPGGAVPAHTHQAVTTISET